MRRLVLLLSAALVVLALYTFQQEGQPDPNLISLAVRATVFAMPSPTAQIVEVTRVVEVTRIVAVTATPVPPTATSTPTITATPELPAEAVSPTDVDAPALALAAAVPAEVIDNVSLNKAAAVNQDGGCPTSSNHQYTSIPVVGAHATHPDSQHGDLNLALRGYVPVEAATNPVDINGPSDGDAPQIPAIVGHSATIAGAYQARDWNWACGELGCRGDLLSNVEVSLVGVATNPGEAVYVPSRGAEIYGGGFIALVLYADVSRLTVVYTREDTVANGYAVHLEDFCVDPNLLSLYQSNNAAGRGSLPAVRSGEAVGVARYNQVIVGVRDRGTFTDPRSRKDWWHGY